MGTEPQYQADSSRATESLVIVGRLLLLLMAGVASVSAFVLSRGSDRPASGHVRRYSCSMHPEVVSPEPDDECPICRMALEPVPASGRGASAAAASETSSLAESANLTVVSPAKRNLFAQEVRAPAWLEAPGVVAAVLYADEAAALLPGERGSFQHAALPAASIAVRLAAEPPAAWDESTSRVRFRIEAGAARIPPGAVGWVTLAGRPRERLVVPAGAVLDSAGGPHVLVAGPDGRTFTRRRVRIGRIYRGLAVVLSGLREGEPVAAANAFFLDAERRLQSLREETAGTAAGGVAQ